MSKPDFDPVQAAAVWAKLRRAMAWMMLVTVLMVVAAVRALARHGAGAPVGRYIGAALLAAFAMLAMGTAAAFITLRRRK